MKLSEIIILVGVLSFATGCVSLLFFADSISLGFLLILAAICLICLVLQLIVRISFEKEKYDGDVEVAQAAVIGAYIAKKTAENKKKDK